MAEHVAPGPNDQSDKDRLVTRPDEKLPTALDPAGKEAHGYPKNPKPEPEEQKPDDIGRSA